MKTYLCADDDMLDAICYRFYDRFDVLDKLLLANRHLARAPLMLAAGTIVNLPDIPATPEKRLIRIWS